MATAARALADLVGRFRPDAAEGMSATYELSLTGDEGGTWHLAIADQKCQLLEGSGDLLAGRLDGFSAYLAGRIQVQGNLSLVMQLQTIFGL
jgi:putative sterol carrier protein